MTDNKRKVDASTLVSCKKQKTDVHYSGSTENPNLPDSTSNDEPLEHEESQDANINKSQQYAKELTPLSSAADISGDVTPGLFSTELVDNFNKSKKEVTDNGIAEQKPIPTKIPSIQRDSQMIASILNISNDTEIYHQLLQNRKAPNRIDLVINDILEGALERLDSVDSSDSLNENNNTATKNQTNEEEDILIADVQWVVNEVKIKVPDLKVDPNEVFLLLENYLNKRNRRELVFKDLTKHLLDINDVDAGVAMETSVKTIMEAYPQADPDVVLGLLEMYRGENGIEQVMNLLNYENDKPAVPGTSTQLTLLEKDLKILQSFYPQCDPNFIFDRLEAHQSNPDRVQLVSQELESNSNYPKLKDLVAKEKRASQLQQLQDLDANFDDLVASFPTVTEYFYETKRPVSDNYKKHVSILLENNFSNLNSNFLKDVAKKYNFHLLPTYRHLENLKVTDIARKHLKKSHEVGENIKQLDFPEQLDEYFFKELLYTKNEEEITGRLKHRAEERTRRFEEAKSAGLLQDCACCYDDEVMLEDMFACPQGHSFCKTCVKKSTEVAVGEARSKFPCLTGTCESDFTLAVIQEAVSAKTFSLVLRRIQEEELRQAGIENLVTCPFCSFATIMENPDDKVFKCLNPECFKQSCRLCREETHIPLSCEENENSNEVNMRTYIENKMTEAMVRICPKCGRRFVKIYGCNSVQCICGYNACYVCLRPFTATNSHMRCTIDSDTLHRREVKYALIIAKAKYLEKHPEAKKLKLTYDPKEHLNHQDRLEIEDLEASATTSKAHTHVMNQILELKAYLPSRPTYHKDEDDDSAYDEDD